MLFRSPEAEHAWPVIVKPTRSVASDHVTRCWTPAEVERAVAAILDQPNVLGARNDAALLQEFLDGDEYVVDTVSYNGHARVTAFWQYDRPRNTPTFVPYNAMRLLPYTGERQSRLSAFADRLLKSLGIQFGPAHCEIMWVDNEPVLIEVGARMSAGNNATLSHLCGGISQLEETIAVLLDPQRFLASLSEQPVLDRYAANVFLAPPMAGRLLRTRFVDFLQQLPTLSSMSIVQEPGTWVERVAGRVTLISADPPAIDRDIQSIRALEAAGMFEVDSTLQETSA